MREHCPLCEKNGIKSKIGCYQINWDEAIFMCPSIECPWPIEVEGSLIIQRPVKVYKTQAALQEVANKYFKKEDDPQNGFLSAYTPPQTPEVVLKDTASSSQVPCPVIVPQCTLTTLDVVKDDVFSTDNNFLEVSKTCDTDTNNPSIKITVSSIKPKIVASKSVNCKIVKVPAKDYVFKVSSDLHSKTNVQLESKKQNVDTSFIDSSSIVKTKPLFDKTKPKHRIFSKFKSKIPYEKFSFESYKKKIESSKIKTDGDLAVSKNVITSENNVNTAINFDKLGNNETIVNTTDNLVCKADLLNLNDSVVSIKSTDSPIILPDVKDCKNDIDIDFAEFFANNSVVNLNVNENLVQHESATTTNQSDIDSILTDLSQDSNNVNVEESDLDEIRNFLDSLDDLSL